MGCMYACKVIGEEPTTQKVSVGEYLTTPCSRTATCATEPYTSSASVANTFFEAVPSSSGAAMSASSDSSASFMVASWGVAGVAPLLGWSSSHAFKKAMIAERVSAATTRSLRTGGPRRDENALRTAVSIAANVGRCAAVAELPPEAAAPPATATAMAVSPPLPVLSSAAPTAAVCAAAAAGATRGVLRAVRVPEWKEG